MTCSVEASSARECCSADASPAELAHTAVVHGARAFTLVELVMVIALAGVVAVLVGTVMSRPLQGFVDQSRRAELVDQAGLALNRMARDIRLAVPNSLRVTSSTLQLLPIAAAGRYRANQLDGAGPRMDPPQCTQAGATCNIEVLSPMSPASGAQPHWLVIYNTDLGELDDTQSVSVISPKEFTWGGGALSANLQNFRFKYASPQHRFFLVRETVGYRCENVGTDVNGNGRGRLLREVSESLYGLALSQSLIADSVSGCSFTYDPGTNTRNGVATIRLTLSQSEETITLLQQVHVDNAP